MRSRSVHFSTNYEHQISTMSRLQSLKSQLHLFIEAQSSFRVVYHTHTSTVNPLTERLCILDSSFNPPHLGHFSLVRKSVRYPYHHGSPLSNDNIGVVLMFSVENCDKKVPKPAAFEHRLSMMCLFADEIKREMDVPVYVAITDKPIFADKSLEVQRWIAETASAVLNNIKLTFLLGYDTLVRVFDNKYYKPVATTVALKEFMDHNDLFSLTRDDDKQHTLDQQMEYLERIKRGEDPECLKEWGDQIFLVEGEPEALNISSSSIRKAIVEGNNGWEHLTFESIAAYIKEHNAYGESNIKL